MIPIEDPDSPYRLHRLRIDSDSATISYPMEHGARDIGASGWSYRRQHSTWIGIDVDAADHADGLDDDALTTVETALRRLPYIELRRSTGGKGLHCYATLTTPVPTASRVEHAALAEHILARMRADSGCNALRLRRDGGDVDAAGRIMWLWSRRATSANGGLTLIQPASETLTVDGWRPVPSVPSTPAATEDLYDMLASAYPTVPLDVEHQRIIDALQRSGYPADWDADHHLLRTHSVALATIPHRGDYATASEGRDRQQPNCWLRPKPGGAWQVYSWRGREHDSWSHDGEHPTIAYNVAPQPQPEQPDSDPPLEDMADLITHHAVLPAARIEGLLRDGETMALIAPSKARKSHMIDALAYALATGCPWLGTFGCTRGRVLIADNELHQGTIGYRGRIVADAMGVSADQCRERISVLRLRGRGVDIYGLERLLDRRFARDYDVLILDSLYRFLPPATNENDNAQMTRIMDRLDYYADKYDLSIVATHHTPKGSASLKSVADVGAGAGAMARAADSYVVMRPHAEPDHLVLDAVLRTWPPVDPLVLRWEYPIWRPADGMDPDLLAQGPTAQTGRQKIDDDAGTREVVAALVKHGPMTRRALRAKTGIGDDRITRLLDILESGERITSREVRGRGGATKEYRLPA
ncbi:MAG: AAA family ATPase [Dehalococcoidia bacterium]